MRFLLFCLVLWIAPFWLPATAHGEAPSALSETLRRARSAATSMDYRLARQWIDQALVQARAADDVTAEAQALLELATILKHSGASDRALEPVEDAVALLEEHGPSSGLAGALTRRAEALEARGDRLRAERDLGAATQLFRRLGDTKGEADVEAMASVLASRRGEYELALELGLRAMERARPPMALRALSAVAYAQHQLGRWREARGSYDRLIERSWQSRDQRMLSFAYCNRAEVSWQLGEPKPAVDDLWRAVERFEQTRGQTAGSVEERATFLEREIAAYDRLVRYLVDRGELEAAFGVAERLHGRSLLDRLFDRPLGGGDEPAVRASIVDRIGRARLELEATPVRSRDSIRAELLALERSLRRLDAETAPTAARPPVELRGVQSTLEPGEILLSYWVAEERTLVWIVDSERLRLVQIAVPRQRLEAMLDRYVLPLRSASKAADGALLKDERAHLETGRQLYDWLVQPLGLSGTDFERWVVVPDGRLHELPFGALVERCRETVETDGAPVHATYASCRYLGQRCSITYSPSAGVLVALRERRSARRMTAPRSLLALAPSFSDQQADQPAGEQVAAVRGGVGEIEALRGFGLPGPLKHNRREIQRIGRFFEDARLLHGAEANEGALDGALASYRWLHFATHGLVDDDLPLGAGLLLEKSAGEDGLLLIPEVLGIELSAELVTLSACRTGRGRASRAEGLMSLSRAFLAAGASASAVSLWDVDDRSTALLMDAFYARLAAGARPSEALRQAQLWLFEQEGETQLVFKKRRVSYAHPRYWAGFVVVGAD